MSELDDKDTLNNVISSLRSQLNTNEIELIDKGLKFCIFRAQLPQGTVAIKVPQDKHFSNVNDASIDSRVLFDQEFKLMGFLLEHDIASIPDPMIELEAAGFGAIVMSYVPSDDSLPNEFELGALLAKIHLLDVPSFSLSAQEAVKTPELISSRLLRRWAEIKKFSKDLPDLPSKEIFLNALRNSTEKEALLHMDYRRSNYSMRHGSVSALVDWSNALIDPPALEFCTLALY